MLVISSKLQCISSSSQLSKLVGQCSPSTHSRAVFPLVTLAIDRSLSRRQMDKDLNIIRREQSE